MGFSDVSLIPEVVLLWFEGSKSGGEGKVLADEHHLQVGYNQHAANWHEENFLQYWGEVICKSHFVL